LRINKPDFPHFYMKRLRLLRGASNRPLLQALLLMVLFLSAACGPRDAEGPPNIVLIVWDTVRADRMSLYGYDRPTTPFLDKWADGARVFDNCLSVAPTTVPAHASMFTGLMPGEHRTDNTYSRLPDQLTTVAELLMEKGYQTYLYSANPFISKQGQFSRGFETVEHPWSTQYREAARRIIEERPACSEDREETGRPGEPGESPWLFTATGEIALKGLQAWLASRDPEGPFFVFLNYMEAHTPRMPAEHYRRRLLTGDALNRSYQLRDTGADMWHYIFGLSDLSPADLDILSANYDASLMALDDLLKAVVTFLQSREDPENTVIILTSDHGEHLGEHHLLNHQYSVYNELLEIPLVIHYPGKFKPGLERRPVMNIDLFPTLLELAGAELPEGLKSRSFSLLSPRDERVRLAEYPTPFMDKIRAAGKARTDWDSTRYERSLRALFQRPYKLIWSSDGRHELYDIAVDRHEKNNLAGTRPGLLSGMTESLEQALSEFQRPDVYGRGRNGADKDHRERLEALGYVNQPEEQEDR